MRLNINEFLSRFSGNINADEIEKLKQTEKSIVIELEEEQYENEMEVLNEEQTQKFASAVNNLRGKGFNNILFEGEFTPEQALNASRRVTDWINEIKSARIDGEKLTPFEKFCYAYEIASQFYYKEADDDKDVSRRLLHVLNGDKIVCVGFSSLLRHILNGLDIPCSDLSLYPTIESVEASVGNKTAIVGHSVCYVFIDDTKYGLKQGFVSDPTFGSPSREFKKGQSLLYQVVATDEIEQMYEKQKLVHFGSLQEEKEKCFSSVFSDVEKLAEVMEEKQKQIQFLDNYKNRIKENLDDFYHKFEKDFEEIENKISQADLHFAKKITKDESLEKIYTILSSSVNTVCENNEAWPNKNIFSKFKEDLTEINLNFDKTELIKLFKGIIERELLPQTDEEVIIDRFGEDKRSKELLSEKGLEIFYKKKDMVLKNQLKSEMMSDVMIKQIKAMTRVGMAKGMTQRQTEAFVFARFNAWDEHGKEIFLSMLKNDPNMKLSEAQKQTNEILSTEKALEEKQTEEEVEKN